MVHRNRWFTELKNGGSFHGYVSHNQMVSDTPSIATVYCQYLPSETLSWTPFSPSATLLVVTIPPEMNDSIWRSIPLSSCASTLPTNACSRCWEAPEKWAISPHSLVGALEHVFYFSIQLGMSSSQLTNSIIFQMGRSTTNQFLLGISGIGLSCLQRITVRFNHFVFEVEMDWDAICSRAQVDSHGRVLTAKIWKQYG